MKTFDLEQDLKELGYEIVWKQRLIYPFIEGIITIIGAVHAPTKISENWTGIVKFSGQGGHRNGSSGGFLYQFTAESREGACIVLMRAWGSSGLEPQI